LSLFETAHSGFVRGVEEAEFEEALIVVGMSKPLHRTRALRCFRELA
jgi:hypothetical protein